MIMKSGVTKSMMGIWIEPTENVTYVFVSGDYAKAQRNGVSRIVDSRVSYYAIGQDQYPLISLVESMRVIKRAPRKDPIKKWPFLDRT